MSAATPVSLLPELCGIEGCRKLSGHTRNHDCLPTEAWGFMDEKDKNKLAKAGFATPRGGAKGAYQNHVARSSKVIIPFERLADVNVALYGDGYIVRLLPEQYFEGSGQVRPEFSAENSNLRVGSNAFVLYRTHESLLQFPPLAGWQVRSLSQGEEVVSRRSSNVTDHGHFVLRIPRRGASPKRVEGPPQGIFAPEYADDETNFLCKCVLAWLIIRTSGSPYTLNQAMHLRAILSSMELDSEEIHEQRGIVRRSITSCPLCMRFLKYQELHDTVSFVGEDGSVNAAEQIDGATRSTVVNLFHLVPMLYDQLTHIPGNIGWGHAICNTRLGQRPCYSLQDIIAMDLKVGILRDEGVIDTFGWISRDWLMIRSPNGAVWMQLNGDIAEGPPELAAFDAVESPAGSEEQIPEDDAP